jgi:hypothetical protein
LNGLSRREDDPSTNRLAKNFLVGQSCPNQGENTQYSPIEFVPTATQVDACMGIARAQQP